MAKLASVLAGCVLLAQLAGLALAAPLLLPDPAAPLPAAGDEVGSDDATDPAMQAVDPVGPPGDLVGVTPLEDLLGGDAEPETSGEPEGDAGDDASGGGGGSGNGGSGGGPGGAGAAGGGAADDLAGAADGTDDLLPAGPEAEASDAGAAGAGGPGGARPAEGPPPAVSGEQRRAADSAGVPNFLAAFVVGMALSVAGLLVTVRRSFRP